MAQILPYQRQTSDAPGLGVQPQAGGPDYIGQGLRDLAGGLGNAGAMLKERDDKAKAAQSALAMATLNNDLRDLHDQTAQGVQSGDIAPDKAMEQFQTQAGALRDKTFEGLTPQQQQHLAPDYTAISGNLTRNLNVALFQRSQSEAAGTIDQYIEQASRSAARVGPAAAAEKIDAFVDFAGPNAGLSPERMGKIKQSAREGVYLNAFQSAGVAALTKGDAEGLAEVRKQLMSTDGEPIDPQKRMVLQHQLFGYEQHVLAQRAAATNAAAAEQQRRENAAVDVYNEALDLTTQGKSFEPAFIKQMTEASAGTQMQDGVVQLLSKQSVVSGFATKPAPERAALLNSLDAEANASGTNPGAHKMLTALRTLNDKITAGYKENPWAQAQSSGVIQDAQAFDAAKPDNAFKIVQQRNVDIARVEQAAGTKVSPFQPQEIAQLSKAVAALPPESQAPYLGRLGEVIGDIDRINIVATELDKSNKPMALALKLGTDKTTAGRAASEFVLKGAQALADKTVKRDDAALTGWRSDIASQVRGTLGDPQAEDDIINAAYYTRAALDIQGDTVPGFKAADASNANAIKMVIGQPMERAGVKTILPRGFDERLFDDKLKTLTAANLQQLAPVFYSRGQPIKPEQLAGRLSEFGMRRDGSGRYIPVNNGAPITTDAAGTNPLRIRVQ